MTMQFEATLHARAVKILRETIANRGVLKMLADDMARELIAKLASEGILLATAEQIKEDTK